MAEAITSIAIGAVKAGAAKKALAKFFDASAAVASGPVKKRISRWKAAKKIDQVYKRVFDIRKVKTILSPEKSIDLQKFYYPTRVKIDGKFKIIRDLSDFGKYKFVVLKGIAGHGKSMLMRYLTSREMVKGDRLPIFIELRKIHPDHSLKRAIHEEFRLLGITVDPAAVAFFASNGRIGLFLDGFDEVAENDKDRILSEIEAFRREYTDVRIIVTSRPDSPITKSNFFDVFEIADYEEGEYIHVINRMSFGHDDSVRLVSGIKGHASGVEELLKTPLMVALAIVKFRLDQTIPENLANFYDSVFLLLLKRHDYSKGWSGRPRQSELSDDELHDAFECFCFLTRRERKNVYPRREIVSANSKSLKQLKIKASSSKVISDYCNLTNLLLEEAGEYEFIHKSVQEFYAASFVRSRPEVVASKFYTSAAKRPYYWSQELYYLSVIDKYRWAKFYRLPDLCTSIELSRKDGGDSVMALSNMSLGFEAIDNFMYTNSLSWNLIENNSECLRDIYMDRFVDVLMENLDLHDLEYLYSRDVIQENPADDGFVGVSGLSIYDFYSAGLYRDELDKAVAESDRIIQKEIEQLSEFLKRSEDTIELFDD